MCVENHKPKQNPTAQALKVKKSSSLSRCHPPIHFLKTLGTMARCFLHAYLSPESMVFRRQTQSEVGSWGLGFIGFRVHAIQVGEQSHYRDATGVPSHDIAHNVLNDELVLYTIYCTKHHTLCTANIVYCVKVYHCLFL